MAHRPASAELSQPAPATARSDFMRVRILLYQLINSGASGLGLASADRTPGLHFIPTLSKQTAPELGTAGARL